MSGCGDPNGEDIRTEGLGERAKILDAVSRRPGLNKRQVANRCELTAGSAVHHVARLIEDNRLVGFDSPRGNEIILFVAEDAELWQNEQTRILYGRTPTRDVALELLGETAGTTARIAEALGRSASTVRYHLGKLRDRDLARSRQFGRRVQHLPTDALTRWRKRLDVDL